MNENPRLFTLSDGQRREVRKALELLARHIECLAEDLTEDNDLGAVKHLVTLSMTAPEYFEALTEAIDGEVFVTELPAPPPHTQN